MGSFVRAFGAPHLPLQLFQDTSGARGFPDWAAQQRQMVADWEADSERPGHLLELMRMLPQHLRPLQEAGDDAGDGGDGYDEGGGMGADHRDGGEDDGARAAADAAAARKAPGEVQYGTAGVSTPMHLSTERYAMLNGIRLTHVPFRGTGPLVTDLLGGHVKLGMSSVTSVLLRDWVTV